MRDAIRSTVVMMALDMALLALPACGPAVETGPVEVHWDRDACEHCNMALGDRRSAAQVRVPGARRVALFDDPGCALLWLQEQPQDVRETADIWVRDAAGLEWVDARKTKFASGASTPMGYGFAPAPAGEADGLTLHEVWARIEESERERRDPRG